MLLTFSATAQTNIRRPATVTIELKLPEAAESRRKGQDERTSIQGTDAEAKEGGGAAGNSGLF